MSDEIKSINDSLVLASKSISGGGSIPFPVYGAGWGAIQGFESEAQWSSYLDTLDGYGTINKSLQYQRLLGDLSRNSLMVAAIRFLGDSLLEPPIQVKEKAGAEAGKKGDSQIVVDHKLPQLWNHPNEFYDGSVLKKGIAFSLVLSSNAYIIKNFNKVGLWPVELWWEPHWTIRPMFPVDGSQFISHYEVNRGGMWYPLEKERVIHIRDGISPYNQRLGFDGNPSISPELYADTEAASYYATLLGGSGVPQFMVGIDKGMKMDQGKAEAMTKMIVNKTSGAQKGQPFVIGGGRAYKLGISPKDLDMTAPRYAAEDRFCATQGIPAVVLELGSGREHSIYSNVNAAMERAWKSYVCPKLTLIESALNNNLLLDFEDNNSGRYCEHDLSQIQSLQEDQDAKAKRLGGLYKDGIIMRGEARSGMGYSDSDESNEDADKVFAVSSTIQLLDPEGNPVAIPEKITETYSPDQPPEYSDQSLLDTAKSFIKGGPGSGRHKDDDPDEFSGLRKPGARMGTLRKIQKPEGKLRIVFNSKLGRHQLEDDLGRRFGNQWRNEDDAKKELAKLEKEFGTKSLEFSQAILDLLPNGYLNPQAGWINFPSDMNSLNIPRTSMPQVLSSHRGAMVQFLRGRGITHSKEDVLPNTLSPTQAEYRPDKVEMAKDHEGTDRPILVSSDNRVVDGHHQWMAALDKPEETIPIIRLDSEIMPLLLEVSRFPSSGVKDGDDNHKFWKAMPTGKSGVTKADVDSTISFLKRHRYNTAVELISAGAMKIKPEKKSNGDSEILST